MNSKHLRLAAVGGLATLGTALAAGVMPAAAAFTAPASVGADTLLGDSATHTGVYELQNVAETGGGVLILLTLTIVGFLFVRKLIGKGKSA